MSRDTDKDWNVIARDYPYFGVLSNDRFVAPSENDINDFFSSGATDVEKFINLIKDDFPEFSPKSVLDFGCGVGRLLIPMTRLSGRGVGVDIADGMINLARHHIAEFKVNATVQKFIPDGSFDWVNSFIVFQHIPPDRGYQIIKQLWLATAVDGVLTIHVTLFKDASHLAEISNRLRRYIFDGTSVSILDMDEGDVGSMTMFDYDLSKILSLLTLVPGQIVKIQYTIHGGCHGVILIVKKRE